jgi:2,4-dienoyl-CoA reductase-like NADH-dependent reductase (Old Yellow Enzyme family)
MAGIQLAHAGRKGSTARPWEGGKPLGAPDGWSPIVAPSAVAYGEGSETPVALDETEIRAVIEAFARAAARAAQAGFDVVEIHAAHGYLLHEFLSPVSNRRNDAWGGDLGGRMRLLLEIVTAIRRVWPEGRPLLVRLSTTDWLGTGGWTIDDSIALGRRLREAGVDLVDCSSGGIAPGLRIDAGPGYQVGNAARIRAEAAIPTAAIGFITAPEQAEHIVRTGQADMVFLARALLRDPYWPLRAARELGAPVPYPPQYERAWR